MKKKKHLCCPGLQPEHKVSHFEFARKVPTWQAEWKCVLWSDEKKFNLDGPDGYRCYWLDPDLTEKSFSKWASGGGSIMVWGTFGRCGTTPLQMVG